MSDDLKNRVEELEKRVKELEKVVFWSKSDDKDTLFDDAVEALSGYEQISTSFLQRRLSIGYTRAARLLDQLEREGYIASGEIASPRKVLKNSK
jgi:S-DNA-T family DNA segregation ATPase FtsK/SpoIIIE